MKYFPWLPGLRAYTVIARRPPLVGEYFVKQGVIYRATTNQSRVYDIVIPARRTA